MHWDAEEVFGSESKVAFLASADDGRLWLDVDGEEICYHVDYIHHSHVKKLLDNRAPGSEVLEFLRTRVYFATKNGEAWDWREV